MCTGGHVNLLHPSNMIAEYHPRKSFPPPSFPAYEGQEKNESKSPSKSPLKKKIRRIPAVSTAKSDFLEYSSDEDAASGEDRNVGEARMYPQQLFAVSMRRTSNFQVNYHC
jgi:hypothetical protein